MLHMRCTVRSPDRQLRMANVDAEVDPVAGCTARGAQYIIQASGILSGDCLQHGRRYSETSDFIRSPQCRITSPPAVPSVIPAHLSPLRNNAQKPAYPQHHI